METWTDADRFPLMDEQGRALLQKLREHPHAPRYNYRVGDQLDAAALADVKTFAQALQSSPRGWSAGERPSWVADFVAQCADVPFYRQHDLDRFEDIPPTSREDLRQAPWDFVPDSASLDGLVVYTTSGTTASRMLFLASAASASMYLPLMQAAMARHGADWKPQPGRVAVVQVCMQTNTFTFASISSFLGGAGYAKINLHPSQWNDSADPVHFLQDTQPQLITGNPLAFEALARLPVDIQPNAFISTAMTLHEGLAQELTERFGCPVIDMYSCMETGPIAVRAGDVHEILPHDLFVEIVDPAGHPLPPGTRGEIVVTGGRNRFLPLLRYKTGDHAAMEFRGSLPVLVGLEGRSPVTYVDSRGQQVNNIDVTAALHPFPVSHLELTQADDGSLRLRLHGNADADEVRQAMTDLFGPDQALHIEDIDDVETWQGKRLRYT